ncbi:MULTISPECIES: hypothetical protein [Heyndrickxia]|uniref:hypothetical protein n=1 Tax=Heyndrickxia TaxID=2837504 RepID=UPI001B2E87AA|nr:hypothetical protein [Heyndrickxia oleronia]GIN42060.1 hypothetical protein J19TS1_50090 [Heyndrickxia oleronia]
MYYYRNVPVPNQSRQFFPFLFGAPLLGGFVGGLLGSALARPRPYPYPPPYGPYPYGPYGGGYGPGPYGY